MGRSVLRHPDAEVTIEWWHEEGMMSECQECDAAMVWKDWNWEVEYEPSLLQDDGTEWPEHEHKGWEDYDGFHFEDLTECLQEDVIDLFSSMYKCDGWVGREVHVIAENHFAEVSISEYCGLAALCLAPKTDVEYGSQDGLAQHWVEQVAPKFLARFNGLR